MIDWHCHILPGIDDGSADADESLIMARALASSGFVTVCCTPHRIKGVYDNTSHAVREATKNLQQHVDDAGLELTLLAGMEYVVDEFLLDCLADPLLLPGNLLLVEIPHRADPSMAAEILYQLVRRKITPLIAHPERCDLFSTTPSHSGFFHSVTSMFTGNRSRRNQDSGDSDFPYSEISFMEKLRAIGCAFQGNLGSFAGMYGGRARERALAFLSAGIYNRFGSDLHSSDQCRILKDSRSFIVQAR